MMIALQAIVIPNNRILYSISVNPNNGLLMLIGYHDTSPNEGYVAQGNIVNLNYVNGLSDFTPTQSTPSPLYVNENDTISIVSYFHASLNITNETSQTSHTIQETENIEDLYFNITDFEVSITENSNASNTIGLSCSFNGSLDVEGNLTYSNDSSAPSWVSLDSANYELKIYAPEVASDTTYNLIYNTTISPDLDVYFTKRIIITVLDCLVQNCSL